MSLIMMKATSLPYNDVKSGVAGPIPKDVKFSNTRTCRGHIPQSLDTRSTFC